MKKRVFAILSLVLMLALVLAACGGNTPSTTAAPSTTKAPETKAPESTEAPAYVPKGRVVVYSASSEDQRDLEKKLWAEKYPDCELEFISAGSGELTARIEAEKDSPKADVMIGGSASIYAGLEPYLEAYVSPEKANILPSFSGDTDLYTPVQINVNSIMVNDELLEKAGVTIDGWESLTQEALKGKISFCDPSSASSSREHIINMLCAMAKKDGKQMDDEWDFVKKFLANLDGKMATSSSQVPVAVATGEYVVGTTNEELIISLMLDGEKVHPVYAKEGITLRNSFMGLIKGGPNPENGKAYIDFMLSKEVQQAHADELHQRSVRPDVTFAGLEGIPASDQLPALNYPTEWVNANKDLKTKLQDIISNLGK